MPGLVELGLRRSRGRLCAARLLAGGGALAVLSVSGLAAAVPASAADPTIMGVPSNMWERSSNPPIEFKVKNVSANKSAHINSLHIRPNVPGSAATRPLNVYRTTSDGRTSAVTPNCFTAAGGD